MFLLSDPYILASAIIAVTLAGMSKGGLGGAMGMLGVPIMALTMPPVQAAAILLPIYIVMDVFSLWSWRNEYDKTTLKIMLPGAIVGIIIGAIAAAYVSDNFVRLLVGFVAIGFVVNYLFNKFKNRKQEQIAPEHHKVKGRFWGTIAGFTSFISHTGGPPYQVYALPLKQTPRIYTGTSVRFFFVVNVIKVAPYFALGQFDATNIESSLILLPLAPIATLAGAWIVKRMDAKVFYPMMYILMFIAGLKLIYDGVII